MIKFKKEICESCPRFFIEKTENYCQTDKIGIWYLTNYDMVEQKLFVSEIPQNCMRLLEYKVLGQDERK